MVHGVSLLTNGVFFFGGSWWIYGISGGFTSGVDGGFLGFCRLDVVVVRVWCSGGGDYGVAAMVDRQLLWFWVSFFSFLFFFFCWWLLGCVVVVGWWLFRWVLVIVGLGLVVGF